MNCRNCKKYAYVCMDCGYIYPSPKMVHNIFSWFGFMEGTIDHIGKRYKYDNEVEYYWYIMRYK